MASLSYWPPGEEKPWPKCILGGPCKDERQHCSACGSYKAQEHFEPAHYAEFLWALFHPMERGVSMKFKEPTVDKAMFVTKFKARLRGE